MELTDYEYRRLLGLIGEERIWWQHQLRLKPDDKDVQRRVEVEVAHLRTIEDKLTENQREWQHHEQLHSRMRLVWATARL